MSELNKFVGSIFEMPALEEISAGSADPIDRGALILEAFRHMRAAKQTTYVAAREHGLLSNPSGPDFYKEWELDATIRGHESLTLNKVAYAVAGTSLLLRSLPGQSAIINRQAGALPYATAHVPSANPLTFRTEFGPTNFHLVTDETGELITVTPLNPSGETIVAIQELPPKH